MKLFGTAGIRGLTNIEITPQFALDLGSAYACLLNNKGKVAVARDNRYGALAIQHAFIAGLLSNGIDVEDCGIVPTPTLACYIANSSSEGGAIITGSHLAYNRIGLIFFRSNGACLSSMMEEEFEKKYSERVWEKKRAEPESIGKLTQNATAQFIHRDIALSGIDSKAQAKIASKKFRVLLDPCNGTACQFFASVIRDLGCEVIEINSEQSPIPSRAPEPKPENLRETARNVMSNDCDLGFALDTDGDRVVVIAHNGEIIPNDNIATLLAEQIFSKEKGICVTPINASMLIEWLTAKYNSKVEYCRVGAPAIAEKILSVGASFGYEETGKYFFSPMLWPDALLGILKILAITADRESLTQLLKEFPKFYQKKQAIECEEFKKTKVMEKVDKTWNDSGVVKTIKVDGIKKFYENSWLLIRASGTEPLIRIFSEAQEPRRAEELLRLGIELVSKATSD
ncbi:MAG: phosphoglucomutase [Candidatus Thermoplasmatota archaeon]|nr:phosphoglucomutase [Candidatus Thermoplasmatota archaeon]